MATLAVLAAVPWLALAAVQTLHQWRNGTGDIHAEPEHWAAVGVMALAIAAAGLIGSSDRAGWRLPAWFAVVGSLAYGAHSLAFPSATSAASTVWAIAIILWGIAYGVSIVRRRRREPPA